MSNATKFPLSSEMYFGQWSNPTATAPKLAAPIDDDDTIITVTAPLKDKTDTVVTGGFLMGLKKSTGWVETIWIPEGAVSTDGLTIGTALIPIVRGINPNGYDYTTGSSDYADSHDAREPVFCNISALIPELIRQTLQGIVATGGSDFIIGTDAEGTVTISRSTGEGTYVGFMRWNNSTDVVEYSNDGSSWVSLTDTSASVVFKVSSNDTTAGYLEDKLVGDTGVTLTVQNDGGNETLLVTVSISNVISEHGTYTVAYMTGGTSAETTIALWDSVTDGSFRITINGTAYNIDGIDFTSAVGGDMDDIASIIQTAIRTATSSTETCVWDTDHFIITSVDTTSDTEISVTDTSTGTVGTDISGAGASDWMDCDAGTETAGVLDPTADEGKIDTLDANGLHKSEFLPSNLQEICDTGTTNVTATELETLTDGSNADDLHIHEGSDPQKYWRTFTVPLGYTGTDTNNWVANNVGTGTTTHNAAYTDLLTSSSVNDVESLYTHISNIQLGARLQTYFNDLITGQVLVYENFFRASVTTPTDTEFRMGFGQATDGAFQDDSSEVQAKFLIDDTQAKVITCSGAGAITTTNVTLSNPSYGHVLRIEFKVGYYVKFYIDDVLVNTSTSNIPLNSLSSIIYFYVGNKTTTTAAKSSYAGVQPYIAISK